MKAFVFVNLNKKLSKEIFPEVLCRLAQNGVEVVLEEKMQGIYGESGCTYSDIAKEETDSDIIITIGGDGTILRYGKLAARLEKPLLGINTGRLGFMATLESNELERLSLLTKKQYKISRRMMINAELVTKEGRRSFNALNDVVLFKSGASKLPEYIVSNNKTEVSRIRADGLIISTPTGSTAYSLSAGGPIIDPELECFEVTSLCPHTLFSRPMIFSAGAVITVRYKGYENSSVYFTVDGGEGIELNESDCIELKKSELCLDLIDLGETSSFYSSIHNKLMRPLK